MRRRFTAIGKPRKSASPASAKAKRRPRPKIARRPADAAAGQSEPERLRRELNEALERETASAEILASIRESTSDTRPVFEAILDNLLRLFGTRAAGHAQTSTGAKMGRVQRRKIWSWYLSHCSLADLKRFAVDLS
jgi:hypothetical protein